MLAAREQRNGLQLFSGRARHDVNAAFEHVAFVHQHQVGLPAPEHLHEHGAEIFPDFVERVGEHLLRLDVDAVDHFEQLLFRLDQIVILPGQKLVALFGLLVFVDGDEVDRPHFVDAFLQDGHLLRHGIPVGGSAAGGHLFGRERANPGRTFVGKCDGDALAANIVEVNLIFLLDPFPQVLHRHVFLRQFHLETRQFGIYGTCLHPFGNCLIDLEAMHKEKSQ